MMFTPMFYAHVFASSPLYRDEVLRRSHDDTPLVVQFSSNNKFSLAKAIDALVDMHDEKGWESIRHRSEDPSTQLASLLSSPSQQISQRDEDLKRKIPAVVAVDINFGCPLKEATRDGFGAHLLQTANGRNKVRQIQLNCNMHLSNIFYFEFFFLSFFISAQLTNLMAVFFDFHRLWKWSGTSVNVRFSLFFAKFACFRI